MSGKSIDAGTGVRAGDWIAVHQIGGGAPRRGQVIEVLGGPGHVRYRVRWDEKHESIHFPSDGTSIERRAHRPPASTTGAEESIRRPRSAVAES